MASAGCDSGSGGRTPGRSTGGLHSESASELASRELDESLGGLERIALWGHLLVCCSCRRFRVQIRLIRTALRLRDQRPIDSHAGDGLCVEARHRVAWTIAEAPLDETGNHDHDRA
ncbi:MAG TPA: hypothetical protein VFF52_03150 [Isosphaeraceae bacterium]|nr:hypothetical protein [Isosphaeraceae bacterium]